MLIERKEETWPSFKAFLPREEQAREGSRRVIAYEPEGPRVPRTRRIRKKVAEVRPSITACRSWVSDNGRIRLHGVLGDPVAPTPTGRKANPYEKLKTLYDYGIRHPVPEMVMNQTPRSRT